jgi:hypothetical protein
MPRYIIERTVPSLSREQLEASARKSKQVIAGMPGVVWIKSYVSEAEGKIYCEYDAPEFQWIKYQRSRWRSVRICFSKTV